MFCTECGQRVPDGGKFCPACGHPQSGDAATRDSTAGSTTSAPRPAAAEADADSPRTVPNAQARRPELSTDPALGAAEAGGARLSSESRRRLVAGAVVVAVVAVVAVIVVGRSHHAPAAAGSPGATTHAAVRTLWDRYDPAEVTAASRAFDEGIAAEEREAQERATRATAP